MKRSLLARPVPGIGLVLVAGTILAVLFGYSAYSGARSPVELTNMSSSHAHGAGSSHHNVNPQVFAGVPANAALDVSESSSAGRPKARTPDQLLAMLGERIEAQDVDGIIALHEPNAAIVNWDGSIIRGHQQIRAFYLDWFASDPVLKVNPLQTTISGGESRGNGRVMHRSASVMGTYWLEQNAADGTRESFSGNFCDIVREQADGTWLYVQDNPYPPHGTS